MKQRNVAARGGDRPGAVVIFVAAHAQAIRAVQHQHGRPALLCGRARSLEPVDGDRNPAARESFHAYRLRCRELPG